MIQFFVNKGEWVGWLYVAVPHAIVSHVLEYGSEGYCCVWYTYSQAR